MSETQRHAATQYRSYLLRMWPAGANSGAWRVVLEEIGQGGERRHFSDLEALFDFLTALERPDDTVISGVDPTEEEYPNP